MYIVYAEIISESLSQVEKHLIIKTRFLCVQVTTGFIMKSLLI